MKRALNVLGRVLGLLALGALVVVLVLSFGSQRSEPVALQGPPVTPTLPPYPPPGTPTPPPYPPPGTPTPPRATPTPPRATPTPPPVQPTPTIPLPGLGDYIFGEPQIVLTHTSAIGIAGWLPNNEEILLTLRQPDVITETIETFNIRTGERRLFGARPSIDIRPIWLDVPNKVAFTALSGQQYDLWISGNDAGQARQPVLRDVNWVIAGRGNRVIALPRGQGRLLQVNEAGQPIGAAPIDLRALGFDPDNSLAHFRMAWHPTEPQVAVYDTSHFAIVDVQTGEAQPIDLGEERSESRGYGPRWAFHARWSPDGRHLALLTTVGEPIVAYTELTIVDANSGMSNQVPLGVRYVYDIAWAPNSRYLVSLGQVDVEEGRTLIGLYLVDALTNEVRRMLPDVQFGLGASAQAISWSPNGQTIAVLCPRRLQAELPRGEGRVCSILVSK